MAVTAMVTVCTKA